MQKLWKSYVKGAQVSEKLVFVATIDSSHEHHKILHLWDTSEGNIF